MEVRTMNVATLGCDKVIETVERSIQHHGVNLTSSSTTSSDLAIGFRKLSKRLFEVEEVKACADLAPRWHNVVK
jgi:hypothetical protein